jgi:hypothetical protein
MFIACGALRRPFLMLALNGLSNSFAFSLQEARANLMQLARITTFSPNNFAGVTRAPQRSLVVLVPPLLAKANGFIF